jgi:hypothetical protein
MCIIFNNYTIFDDFSLNSHRFINDYRPSLLFYILLAI